MVAAPIVLGACLDLSDIYFTDAIRTGYDGLREAHNHLKTPMPVNRNKARLLDCLVINYVTTFVLPECMTISAPFIEGQQIYDGSAFFTQSHIQLVVRDQSCIRGPLEVIARE